MADIYVYGYSTYVVGQDFFVLSLDALKAYTPTQFVLAGTGGIFNDQLVFNGAFTVNSGGVSSGTITELKVESSSGRVEVDITGISVPITNGSFNSGPFLATGSTYYDEGVGSSLEGKGNDTYYTSVNTHVFPAGGLNTIYGTDSQTMIYFTGASSAYTIAAGSNGTAVVIDSTATRNGYNIISGSATLVFDGDSVSLQDVNGVVTVPATASTAVSAVGGSSNLKAGVTDSAANVLANLDTLGSLASTGHLGSVTLTDSGIPTLSVTAAQSVKDAGALADIASYYVLNIAAGSGNQTIDGVSGQGSEVTFTGAASQFTITSGGGSDLIVSGSPGTDTVHGATALKFSDLTDFVASQTPATPNGVSSFQVATLYAAVLGRTPDVAGLAYYEAQAAANPSLPFIQYAEQFLQAPEYTGAHTYSQTPAGDSSFITDTYQNLLHRAPGAGDVAWYQANVINPVLATATPGTSGYTAAELAAHAAVLADFSQSAEFKTDVQVTAQTPSSAQHWLILT